MYTVSLYRMYQPYVSPASLPTTTVSVLPSVPVTVAL